MHSVLFSTQFFRFQFLFYFIRFYISIKFRTSFVSSYLQLCAFIATVLAQWNNNISFDYFFFPILLFIFVFEFRTFPGFAVRLMNPLKHGLSLCKCSRQHNWLQWFWHIFKRMLFKFMSSWMKVRPNSNQPNVNIT